MTIILVLGLLACVSMLALLLRLASLALPLYGGLGLSLTLIHHGHGYIGAMLVGLLAGVGILYAGTLLLKTSRSLTTSWAVTSLFVLPAAFAGYQAVHALADIVMGDGLVLTTVSMIGATVIGRSAWHHLVSPP